MAAARYRYIVWNWADQERVEELPLVDVVYGVAMNRATTATASLPLKNGDAINALYVSATTPRRHMLIIERGGLPVWAGLIWLRSYDSESQTLQLGMGDLWSWVKAQPASVITYTNTNLYGIAKGLIEQANDQIGDLIAYDPPVASHPVQTDLVVPLNEFPSIGDLVENLAGRDDGFDWAFEYEWSGEDLAVTYKMEENRGRRVSENGHVFEIGRNVNLLEWTEDAAEAADTVIGLGQGVGTLTYKSVQSDTSLVSQGYFPMTAVVSFKEIKESGDVQALVSAELLQRVQPGFTAPRLGIQGDVEPKPGSYIAGDECTVVIRPGEDPRFPDGFEKFFRIVGWTVNVGNESQETIELDLREING